MLIEWRMVDTRRWSWDFTVVGWGVQVYDVKTVFQQVNTRNKGFTLDSILVELIWVTVGCGD